MPDYIISYIGYGTFWITTEEGDADHAKEIALQELREVGMHIDELIVEEA